MMWLWWWQLWQEQTSKHADQHEAKAAKQCHWFLLDLSLPGCLLGDAAHSGGGPFPSLILSGNGIKDLPQSVVSGSHEVGNQD